MATGSRFNGWALLAAGGALAYVVSKVHLARAGLLGLPGFPVSEEVYAGFSDVAEAQLANAAVGTVAAVLALLLLVPVRRRVWRVALQVISWAGVMLPAAGVVWFGIRALPFTDAVGPQPPDPLTACLTLAVGALWAASWLVAILRQPRPGPDLPVSPTGDRSQARGVDVGRR